MRRHHHQSTVSEDIPLILYSYILMKYDRKDKTFTTERAKFESPGRPSSTSCLCCCFVVVDQTKLTHACFAMGVRGRCQEETLPEDAVSSIRNNPFHGWPNESSLSLCGPYTICGVE